jgi:hypothetical protein
MVEKLGRLEELFAVPSSHIDVYVSTDALEADELLADLGYSPVTSRSEFTDKRLDAGVHVCSSQRACYLVESSDVTPREFEKIVHELGFPPMSFMRIYRTANGSMLGEVTSILKTLRRQNLNMAFVSGDCVHVQISDSYFVDHPKTPESSVVYRQK